MVLKYAEANEKKNKQHTKKQPTSLHHPHVHLVRHDLLNSFKSTESWCLLNVYDEYDVDLFSNDSLNHKITGERLLRKAVGLETGF